MIPTSPMGLVCAWFDDAVARGVREPGALALATASSAGRCSNRIVQVIRFTGRGLVFASFTTSPKGRDLADTGWASGVLYWREAGRQLILTGPVEQLPDSRSDELWAARAPRVLPMSVATAQSEPLADEDALRARVSRLAEAAEPLPRPAAWVGYHLVPSTVEFWEDAPDRFYWRLRYDRDDNGEWTHTRLQP